MKFMDFGRSYAEIAIFQRSTEHQQLEQDNALEVRRILFEVQTQMI